MTFSKDTFQIHCDTLRRQFPNIERLHQQNGYPPYWKRPNNFESLCKTIIEQQVSLASAHSSYKRLKLYCHRIIPENVVGLSIEEFRLCGITRQKARYLNLLAQKVIEQPLYFKKLSRLNNDEAKLNLMTLKGIGNWTANVYLLVALNRVDIYPDFDVALIKSIAFETFGGIKIDNYIAKNYISKYSGRQSIACCYYYHAYILRKNIKFET